MAMAINFSSGTGFCYATAEMIEIRADGRIRVFARDTDGKLCTDKIEMTSKRCEIVTGTWQEIVKEKPVSSDPVKPIRGEAEDMPGIAWWVCPVCKMGIDDGDRFCSHCGRRLNWDE